MAKKASKKVAAKDKRETNASVVKKALITRLPRRVSSSGQMVLPAAPSLLDHYTEKLYEYFSLLGRVFTKEEMDHLKGILERKLDEAYTASPYARVVVHYETDPPPKTSLTYRMSVSMSSIKDEYDGWIKTRTPPYFGAHPDAKVMQAARSLGNPKDAPVLDIGAGTGRNTLPLAREGFPIDAIELTPSLAGLLREEVAKENLAVRVFEGDALAGNTELPEHHYKLVFLSEVIASHIRTVDQVRAIFDGAAEALVAGGLLVFNAFLAHESYRPDAVARELSQVFWCNLFTRQDLATAMQGLPFELVADESTHDFEQENQPAEAWPPTGWFVDWSKGLDLFDLPRGTAPMELRWLTFRRKE
ncbi:MAG TPA: class I SAM-dependent methyltransferase [Polyangiaceae bacterium]